MSAIVDMSRQRCGRLRVLGRATNDSPRAAWECLCDCGTSTIVRGKDLRSGNTSSCGCLAAEARVASGGKNRRHGLTYSPIWQAWSGMRRRCGDPNHKSFKDYGGRGIMVCPQWESFETFYADMAPRPAGMTIERIDNDGDYEPGNCRWATWTEQARNKRSNVAIEAFGETKIVVAWAEDSRCAVSLDALQKRIEAGWPSERALTETKYASRRLPWAIRQPSRIRREREGRAA